MLRIRDAYPKDETVWRTLWADYITFYGATVPEEVTARTWQRILDPASPTFCRLVERDVAIPMPQVVGFAVCVLHEGTFSTQPLCYLEDLFVAPAHRGIGIGRMILKDLQERAFSSGWSHLYWHTRQDNPARKLYDEFVQADDFVRYRLEVK
jgi:ribosomal protein S18 acetylase RimI-like enzyme